MAIVCEKYKLIFVMVPGTGCTMIGKVLRDQFDGEWLVKEEIKENGKVVLPQKHPSMDQILRYGVLKKEDLQQYTVFATIRNPYDRFVTIYQRYVGGWKDKNFRADLRKLESEKDQLSDTAYQNRRAMLEKRKENMEKRKGLVKSLSFPSWMGLTMIYWKWRALVDSQTPMMERAYPMIGHTNYLLYYEKLEEAFNELLRKKGIDKSVVFPVINPTPGKKHFSNYHNGFSRGVIRWLLRRELKIFGYTFSGPKGDELVVKNKTS